METKEEKKEIEAADKEETEAHKDKEKDEEKNTDDREKDIKDDTAKADIAEMKAHFEKLHNEHEQKIKELEKRIIDALKIHVNKNENENEDWEGIGY